MSFGSSKKQRLLLALSLSAAVVLLSFAGLTAARYVLKQEKKGVAAPQSFYFTSDLLREGGATYELSDWGTGIPIQLRNYEDALRVTQGEISYTVAYVTDDNSNVNGAAEGSLTGPIAARDKLLVIPNETAKEVTVTVTAAVPYSRTLSATFKATGTLQPQYQVLDSPGEPTATLLVTGGPRTKVFTITYPTGLSLDRTNQALTFTNSSVTLKVEASASYSILIFKEDPYQDYSEAKRDIIADSISLTS